MEEHLARSIGMELHHRVELIDTLLVRRLSKK
jgi:hypothetical protein